MRQPAVACRRQARTLQAEQAKTVPSNTQFATNPRNAQPRRKGEVACERRPRKSRLTLRGGCGRARYVCEDHANYILVGSAKRHADADFADASAHGVREHAVNPDGS